MKVLVVVPNSAGCGAERQAFLHMSALRSESIVVSCVCNEDSWLAAQCSREGISCNARRRASGWLDSFAISRLAKAQAIDMVLGYGEEGIRVGVKISRNCAAMAYGFAFGVLDTSALKGLAGIFVASQSLVGIFEAQSDVPVHYLPPAVPDLQQQYGHHRASERKRLKIDDTHIAICVPGPISRDLGQEIALEALEKFGRHNLRLFLLGSYQHDYGKELRLLAAQNPVASNSMIGQPKDGGIYAAFDVCLAPFQAEHAAQHALTAMSFGLPLVASPLGALEDMVTPGSNGYLATSPSAQSITEALLVTLDESSLAAMGKRSRKIFKDQFTLRQMARGLTAVIYENKTSNV